MTDFIFKRCFIAECQALLYQGQMTTSARIAEARKVRKITQRQLADEMGVSVQAVSQWERGKNAISGGRIVDLSRVLRVSVAWLLGNDEQRTIFDDSTIENVPIVSLGSISDAFYNEIWIGQKWNEFTPVIKDSNLQRFAFRIHIHSMLSDYRLGDLLIFQLREMPTDGDIVLAVVRIDVPLPEQAHSIDYRAGIYEFHETLVEMGTAPQLHLIPLLDKQGDIQCAKTAVTVMAVMIEHRRFRPPRTR